MWKTVQRRVSELAPWDKNPRRLTKKQEEDLKRSICKFNLMSIPVVDFDGRIVSGHQRVHILRLLGRGDEIIDVRFPNRRLSEAEYQEASLRENQNHGEWDDVLLAAIDEDVLSDVGFDEADLARIFGLDRVVELGDPVFQDEDPLVKYIVHIPKSSVKEFLAAAGTISAGFPGVAWVRA